MGMSDELGRRRAVRPGYDRAGDNRAGDEGAGADSTALTVDLEIGQVVLTGFGRIDGDAVASALRRELTRLLRGRRAPLARAGGDGPGPSFRPARLPAAELPPAVAPDRLGRSLARVVFREIGGEPEVTAPAAAAVLHPDAAPGSGRGGIDPAAPGRRR